MKYLIVVLLMPCLLIFSGCRQDRISEELVKSLSALDGKFYEKDSTYYYDQGNKIRTIVQKYQEKDLIPVLYRNIDNESLSQSSIEGKKLPVGFIFYEALTQTIYYEPVDSLGDIRGDWDGYFRMQPGSSLRDLTAAKKAWKPVIYSKTYNSL
jgi:hypothetical protein